MRLARGLLGSLLWILAGLLGLVAILLCVTVILLPLGIPLLKLSRKLFGRAVRLLMPPAVVHPVKHTGRRGRKEGRPVSRPGGLFFAFEAGQFARRWRRILTGRRHGFSGCGGSKLDDFVTQLLASSALLATASVPSARPQLMRRCPCYRNSKSGWSSGWTQLPAPAPDWSLRTAP